MKLVHPNLSYQFEFTENSYHTIIVENPAYFTNFCQELFEQCNGKEGQFVLSKDDRILAIDKSMYMIIDPFSLDFNQRKILTKLYTEMKDIALSPELYQETNTLLINIEQYALQLIEQSEYPIKYAENMDISGIFKMADFKIETDYNCLVEKIVDYLKLMHDICNLSICVLINIKTYLSKEDIDKIYEFAEYNKIYILLIESSERNKNAKEKVYILDQDNCEIY